MNKPLYLELPIRVNAYDVDAMGFVSNIVYIRWFEDMRMNFLDKYYPYKEMIKSNQSPVLAKTEIEYKKGLTIHDHVIGKSWAHLMGPIKWEMEFLIESEQGVHCAGRQYGYYIDIVKKRPIKIPPPLVEAFEKDLDLIKNGG